MEKIIFKRPKENFNQGVTYKIYVGNNMLCELKNGEEKTIEISSELENKPIKAKMYGWFGSEQIELNSLPENRILNVKGNKFLNKRAYLIPALLPLTGVLMFGYGRENMLVKNIGIGLFILILIFVAGALTIGRNKWLNIERIDLSV